MYAHNTNRHPANNPNTAVASSPVCGSLDPPSRSKKTTKSGWRYIQCGDTQDELRVLIPPRPAAIYANLLKVEAHALAKNDAESARDVQYIHQLKDAMIKRCQKLAQQAINASPDPLSSRTAKVVEAPLDFKLKRLEMWWETMEANGKTKGSPDQPQPTHSAHPGRRSKIHATSSTATISPNKNQLAVSVAQANGSHVISPQSSPNAQRTSDSGRRRPAPLNVSPSGHASSGQPSPSMSHSPHKQMRPSHNHTSSQASQSPYAHAERPHLRPAMAYRPAYSNSQTASPMDMHNPYFDPNQSLAATSSAVQQYHASPASSRNGLAPHSPSVALRNDTLALANDPRLNRQIVYSIADALSEPTAAQVDPSYLKNRFNATYISSSSNSTSSPSSSSSKPSPYAQQHPSNSRENVGAYYATQDHLQPTLGHTRARASFSMPLPGNANSSSSDREHRRRATVDCEDTDRSVPRPKGYMYSSTTHHNRPSDTLAPDMHYNEQAYGAQGIRQADADHSPSAFRRVAQALKQNFLPGGSPMSSAGSGSPRSRGSPSGHSQGSPGNHSQQGYSYANGSAYNGSPNLLPPAPALSRSRRGSNESVIQANRTAQDDGTSHQPKQQLRRTLSRRSLRDRSPSGTDPAAAQPQTLAPGANYYTTQLRSPRRGTVPTPDTHQPTEGDGYRRGRTRRGERSPRRSSGYDASPRRGDPVIPDMAILTPATSARNSRYTSGGSSVSEPVIPDVSLIMEAELSRSKADRVRRRLVPCRSSSEEGGGRYDSASDSDLSSSDDENDGHGGGEIDYYRRPYRARDGYGSEYASDAGGMGSRAPSRTPSRPPSRPPSRGILKRSSSMCSQRSSKSVRLEIPRDRRALEEVRDAEDKVDRAQKQLEDLQKRTGGKSKIVDAEISRATEALNQAKRSLKEKDDEYQTILEAMKLKRSEQDEAEPRYV